MTLLIIGFSIADFLLPTILVFAFRWDDVHDVYALYVTSRQFQRDEMARNAVPVSTKQCRVDQRRMRTGCFEGPGPFA